MLLSVKRRQHCCVACHSVADSFSLIHSTVVCCGRATTEPAGWSYTTHWAWSCNAQWKPTTASVYHTARESKPCTL